MPSEPPSPDTADDPSGSITGWIAGVRAGDGDAARRLWERYFRRLTHLSRGRLWGSDRREADEEDVALSAFASFCRGAGGGRFPALPDRDRLWSLLAGIVARKAADRIARERCVKRGGRAGRAAPEALDGLAGSEPPPDLAAEMADTFARLLDRLPDPSLRAVAVLRFEGYGGEEIARHLGCGVRTVERKLVLIRRLWAEDSP